MLATILHLLVAGQAAATPAAAPSLQQLFDRASQSAADGKCAEALQDFAAVEARVRSKPNPLLTGAIDVRKGSCLVNLRREEEGEAALRRGLPVLAGRGKEFTRDVRDGQAALGGVLMRRFDYAGAAAAYREALDRSEGSDRILPLMSLAQVLAFDGDGEALRYATEARTIVFADPGMSKDSKAAVQTIHARVLLNQGQLKEAYAELKEGLQKQGGLGNRVGIGDIVTRSDLAVAAMLNRDRDSARRYLAYTGAGRMQDTPFGRAASMQPPLCGGATGLKPEDFAIIEFSLGDDGAVSGVLPVYTTGGREVALAFARAVSEWSWRPEDVKSVPALFRYATRVELRCTRVGERPDLTDPLADRFQAWAAETGTGGGAWADLPDARAIAPIRAAVASARTSGNRPALVQALAALGANRAAPDQERSEALEEAIREAAQTNAPVPVQTYLAIERIGVAGGGKRDREDFRTLLARADVAADPLSAATLRLLIAVPGYRRSRADDAMPLLQSVADAPELPAQHPLKVNALLQQATILADKGDLAAARALFDRTGLDEGQCALIGLRPALRRSGASTADYPMEAVRMGFEGWGMTEFDIAADGRTIAPRVVAAYPPFIFNEAAASIFRDARYESSYRPSGGLACTAEQKSISFKLQGF
ncbi:energy transducer TonB [Sphingomonas sp. PL-96]|uniref:energy transducer TonB n=1 Tax=Sphingomonas sp. PL-96 TaxID=2887201 RepID=UPI001E65997A|nr:energy transducer TonB [Sphingomonas sp. PL-96]MCC2975563.1 energy transducer TonB [Sphingomonas sp. PL-96]